MAKKAGIPTATNGRGQTEVLAALVQKAVVDMEWTPNIRLMSGKLLGMSLMPSK